MTPSQKSAIIARLAPELERTAQGWQIPARTVAQITAQHCECRHDEYSTVVNYLIKKGVTVK